MTGIWGENALTADRYLNCLLNSSPLIFKNAILLNLTFLGVWKSRDQPMPGFSAPHLLLGGEKSWKRGWLLLLSFSISSLSLSILTVSSSLSLLSLTLSTLLSPLSSLPSTLSLLPWSSSSSSSFYLDKAAGFLRSLLSVLAEEKISLHYHNYRFRYNHFRYYHSRHW